MEDQSTTVGHPKQNLLSGVPYILIGLLVFLPLPYAAELTWYEYVRVGLITLGLAYLWRGHSSERTSIFLLAGALVFALVQFDPATRTESAPTHIAQPHTFLWFSGGFAISAAAIYFFTCRPYTIKPGFWDWLVLGIALGVLLISTGSSLSTGEIRWFAQIKVAIAVLVWFLVTRSIPARPEMARRFKMGVLGVFATVLLVGCARVGSAFYYYKSGERTQRENNVDAAIRYYERGAKLGKELNLGYIGEVNSFRLAGILFEQGKLDESARALSLEKDFVVLVQPEEWKGPEGGNLHYLTSCWKDLVVYEGEIEIRIFAHGTPVFDEWPLMRVKLGDRVRGDVFVTSREPRPYVFTVKVKERSTQRLEISFLNDFHQAKPYIDRNLIVEQAEIQYRRIAWK